MEGQRTTGASESEPRSSVPRAFGQYLLFDRIGQGGMAEIFLARTTTELGGSRRLVVKEVLPELSNDRSFATMLIREAKLAAKLNHRNVVNVMDLGRESGRLFIAMEYVEGFDLNQLLRELSRRKLPLPAEFALLVVREVLAALDYAHRARDDDHSPLGIVHRDVSPSNVLISFEGEVSLCDFGIARALSVELDAGSDHDGAAGSRARIAGKSAYMAPEHARGGDVDSRSDVFAAGILLWELCAGRRLYKGSEPEMLEMARSGDTPELPNLGLPNHGQLQTVVRQALAVDPGTRYQTAREMLEAVEEYALANGLMASQLRFGSFLTDNFAEQIVALRRSRELAAEAALTATDIPITEVEPVTLPSEPPGPRPSPRQVAALVPEPAALPAPANGRAWLWVAVAVVVLGLAATLMR